MLVILLVVLLILAIAFYQVLQGLYSAMIMLLLSIISAMVAFNYYLQLSELLYEQMTAYTEPVMLVGLFAITLFVLRLLYDRFLGANVVLGTWADRIGGGIFGLLTGMVLTGMATIGMQMLPFPESVMGYRPYDELLQRDQHLQPFRPDEFTLGLMGHLSAGSMAGRTDLENTHGDLLLDAFCARNTAGKNGGRLAKPETLSQVTAYQQLPGGLDIDDVPRYPLKDRGRREVLIVRTRIDREIVDPDGWWRIPGTQVRLTTEDGDGRYHHYYPVAFLSGRTMSDRGEILSEDNWRLHNPELEDDAPKLAMLSVEREHYRDEQALVIDWAFSVREGHTPVSATFRGISTSSVRMAEEGALPDAEDALTRTE